MSASYFRRQCSREKVISGKGHLFRRGGYYASMPSFNWFHISLYLGRHISHTLWFRIVFIAQFHKRWNFPFSFPMCWHYLWDSGKEIGFKLVPYHFDSSHIFLLHFNVLAFQPKTFVYQYVFYKHSISNNLMS